MIEVDALLEKVETIDLKVVDIALDGMLMKDGVGCLVHCTVPLAHPSLHQKHFQF
jgi:hypothetical protein